MKEIEIRPKKLMDEYIKLSAEDTKHYFSNLNRRELVCVACGHEDTARQFSKNDFDYSLCNNCKTLYQTPRPNIESFEAFYSNSNSSRYWAEVFYPSVAETRRKKIFQPRVNRLRLLCDDLKLDVKKIIDVGSGFGIFLDEWRSVSPNTELLAIEPSEILAEECRQKNLKVVQSIVEKVDGFNNYADLVVCFEVLEHVDSPLDFINTLKNLTKPGGYVFISTLCIDGFDLQLLWDKSSQISPPHHINFLSVMGFRKLFERAGLEDIKVLTPGELDIDIVKNFIKNNPHELEIDSFLERILEDEYKSIEFQKFLSENLLSSHAWVIGKKLEP